MENVELCDVLVGVRVEARKAREIEVICKKEFLVMCLELDVFCLCVNLNNSDFLVLSVKLVVVMKEFECEREVFVLYKASWK